LENAPVTFPARILRKEVFLPRYIVVKSVYVGRGNKPLPADVMLNETGPFRRRVRPWGKGSDVFFFNLTVPQCEKANLTTDDTCVVVLNPKG
jgi:hypothetical protein